MSMNFDPEKRIYDLYSFDAPYDLEPTSLCRIPCDYAENLANNQPISAKGDEKGNKLEGLDLTFDEAEPRHRFPAHDFRLFPDREFTADSPLPPPLVLGGTLTQRKTLLKERIDELNADIRKREWLEEQMLEKADIEVTGLGLLLGHVKDFSPGNYPSVDVRRTSLEREIIALKKAGWDERLRCWRDLVMLKKELRAALEEYHLILSVEGM